MVRPQELIEAVLETLKQSDNIPDSATFLGYTPDINSESIKLPIVEVSTGVQEHVSPTNTDFIGFQTDANGNEIGRIYNSLYTLELNIAVWTTQGSKYSPRKLSNAVRDSLYDHETAGPNRPLEAPDGSTVDEVYRFSLIDGEQTDDLSTSPPLRRWQQDVLIDASEQYITDGDDPIEAFDVITSPS